MPVCSLKTSWAMLPPLVSNGWLTAEGFDSVSLTAVLACAAPSALASKGNRPCPSFAPNLSPMRFALSAIKPATSSNTPVRAIAVPAAPSPPATPAPAASLIANSPAPTANSVAATGFANTASIATGATITAAMAATNFTFSNVGDSVPHVVQSDSSPLGSMLLTGSFATTNPPAGPHRRRRLFR